MTGGMDGNGERRVVKDGERKGRKPRKKEKDITLEVFMCFSCAACCCVLPLFLTLIVLLHCYTYRFCSVITDGCAIVYADRFRLSLPLLLPSLSLIQATVF